MLVCISMGGLVTTGSDKVLCLVRVHMETGNVSVSFDPEVTRIIPVEERLGSSDTSKIVRDQTEYSTWSHVPGNEI